MLLRKRTASPPNHCQTVVVLDQILQLDNTDAGLARDLVQTMDAVDVRNQTPHLILLQLHLFRRGQSNRVQVDASDEAVTEAEVYNTTDVHGAGVDLWAAVHEVAHTGAGAQV